ncbi:hypothetical protein NIA69_20210 [Gemmiger formicilis]|nr:hypothetical protein [Gemmiger formicilis]
MSRTKRKRKLVEWLESCQENQVSVLDEKIPLLSFAVDFVTAYEYQKARGIKIHPGLWKDMRVDIFLVKKKIEKFKRIFVIPPAHQALELLMCSMAFPCSLAYNLWYSARHSIPTMSKRIVRSAQILVRWLVSANYGTSHDL